MDLDKAAFGQLVQKGRECSTSGWGPETVTRYLHWTLRLMMKWRSQSLANLYMERHARRVFAGPFKGMTYSANQSEGGLTPKLLGVYEAELHPAIAAVKARGGDLIYDVGCAEGYYAVGLARFMPQARVLAYDIDPNARALCTEMISLNGVGDRVEVRERFTLSDVGEAASGTLVFMDVEGAEADLLDESAPEALRRADLIVETHPGMRPGVTGLLKARFARTHEVELIFEAPKRAPPGAFGGHLLSLDEFAATWEWRGTPTPWLVMRPREG